MARPSQPADEIERILNRLTNANNHLMSQYPNEPLSRQPIQTLYGGAHLFKAETTAKLGALAQATMKQYAPNYVSLACALQLSGCELLPQDPSAASQLEKAVLSNSEHYREQLPHAWLAVLTYQRVIQKLANEPIEDLRVDFEDGYGWRPDAEEDADATRVGIEMAHAANQKTLPAFIGIRIKPLSEELKQRSIRTLMLFLDSLLEKLGSTLPNNFIVTLPKVSIPEQVKALVDIFKILEQKHSLPLGSLCMEIMIESPEALINDQGTLTLPSLIEAAENRLRGVHFGAYDFTAACQITAAHQTLDHPACDFARQIMQMSLSGKTLFLSDGATNILPVGPHRAGPGKDLTTQQLAENSAVVHKAWRLSYQHIRQSMRLGFYQGWDLHPAQLPVRYAACYAFFLEGLSIATERLNGFMTKSAQATLLGDTFDDAATGQGLLNFFLRAQACGAISTAEIVAAGLTPHELQMRSFVKILRSRQLSRVNPH